MFKYISSQLLKKIKLSVDRGIDLWLVGKCAEGIDPQNI